MYENQTTVALEWLNAAVGIAQRPAGERAALWDEWDARRQRTLKTSLSFLTSGLPMFVMPSLSADSALFARHEAELGAMVILLAAERHRCRAGAWPESTAAIDREVLPDRPGDPFTGEDYRMEHRADGRLLVYSVGPNRRDERGAYDANYRKTGGPDDVAVIGWDADRRRPAARPPVEEAADATPDAP
jgi:hypothetical protein